MTTVYNLNLSPKYVPDWGPWEVLREIVCNAMDAAGSKYELTKHTDDLVTVWTPTVPDLHHLVHIGGGTKDRDTVDIGQFGEGFKLAALACTRSREGKFIVSTQDGEYTFELRENLGHPVLHMVHEKGSKRELAGMMIRIEMRNIGAVSLGRFLSPGSPAMQDKPAPGPCQVYVKGVWVTQFPEKSIWDWNLETTNINRDRALVDRYAILRAVSEYLQCKGVLRAEDVETLFVNDGCIEIKALYSNVWSPSPAFCKLMQEGVRAMWGDRTLLPSTEHRLNEIAMARGYMVLNGLSMELCGLLKRCKVPYVQDIIGANNRRIEMPIATGWVSTVKTLDALFAFLSVPVTVKPFKWNNQDTDPDRPQAAVTTDRAGNIRFWIHEDRLDEGVTQELFAAAISAVGNADPRTAKSSLLTEFRLADAAATLAMEWVKYQGIEDPS